MSNDENMLYMQTVCKKNTINIKPQLKYSEEQHLKMKSYTNMKDKKEKFENNFIDNLNNNFNNKDNILTQKNFEKIKNFPQFYPTDEIKSFSIPIQNYNKNSCRIKNYNNSKLDSSQNFKLGKIKTKKEFALMNNFINKNLSKYNVNRSEYENILVESIINNKNIHIVSKLKDFMIYDYVDEFLKRYYTASESYSRLPIFANYYQNYLKFFCIPIFKEIKLNKIAQNHGDNKAELYYMKNYGRRDISSQNLYVPDSKNKNEISNMKKILTTTIKENIEETIITKNQDDSSIIYSSRLDFKLNENGLGIFIKKFKNEKEKENLDVKSTFSQNSRKLIKNQSTINDEKIENEKISSYFNFDIKAIQNNLFDKSVIKGNDSENFKAKSKNDATVKNNEPEFITVHDEIFSKNKDVENTSMFLFLEKSYLSENLNTNRSREETLLLIYDNIDNKNSKNQIKVKYNGEENDGEKSINPNKKKESQNLNKYDPKISLIPKSVLVSQMNKNSRNHEILNKDNVLFKSNDDMILEKKKNNMYSRNSKSNININNLITNSMNKFKLNNNKIFSNNGYKKFNFNQINKNTISANKIKILKNREKRNLNKQCDKNFSLKNMNNLLYFNNGFIKNQEKNENMKTKNLLNLNNMSVNIDMLSMEKNNEINIEKNNFYKKNQFLKVSDVLRLNKNLIKAQSNSKSRSKKKVKNITHSENKEDQTFKNLNEYKQNLKLHDINPNLYKNRIFDLKKPKSIFNKEYINSNESLKRNSSNTYSSNNINIKRDSIERNNKNQYMTSGNNKSVNISNKSNINLNSISEETTDRNLFKDNFENSEYIILKTDSKIENIKNDDLNNYKNKNFKSFREKSFEIENFDLLHKNAYSESLNNFDLNVQNKINNKRNGRNQFTENNEETSNNNNIVTESNLYQTERQFFSDEISKLKNKSKKSQDYYEYNSNQIHCMSDINEKIITNINCNNNDVLSDFNKNSILNDLKTTFENQQNKTRNKNQGNNLLSLKETNKIFPEKISNPIKSFTYDNNSPFKILQKNHFKTLGELHKLQEKNKNKLKVFTTNMKYEDFSKSKISKSNKNNEKKHNLGILNDQFIDEISSSYQKKSKNNSCSVKKNSNHNTNNTRSSLTNLNLKTNIMLNDQRNTNSNYNFHNKNSINNTTTNKTKILNNNIFGSYSNIYPNLSKKIAVGEKKENMQNKRNYSTKNNQNENQKTEKDQIEEKICLGGQNYNESVELKKNNSYNNIILRENSKFFDNENQESYSNLPWHFKQNVKTLSYNSIHPSNLPNNPNNVLQKKEHKNISKEERVLSDKKVKSQIINLNLNLNFNNINFNLNNPKTNPNKNNPLSNEIKSKNNPKDVYGNIENMNYSMMINTKGNEKENSKGRQDLNVNNKNFEALSNLLKISIPDKNSRNKNQVDKIITSSLSKLTNNFFNTQNKDKNGTNDKLNDVNVLINKTNTNSRNNLNLQLQHQSSNNNGSKINLNPHSKFKLHSIKNDSLPISLNKKSLKNLEFDEQNNNFLKEKKIDKEKLIFNNKKKSAEIDKIIDKPNNLKISRSHNYEIDFLSKGKMVSKFSNNQNNQKNLKFVNSKIEDLGKFTDESMQMDITCSKEFSCSDISIRQVKNLEKENMIKKNSTNESCSIINSSNVYKNISEDNLMKIKNKNEKYKSNNLINDLSSNIMEEIDCKSDSDENGIDNNLSNNLKNKKKIDNEYNLLGNKISESIDFKFGKNSSLFRLQFNEINKNSNFFTKDIPSKNNYDNIEVLKNNMINSYSNNISNIIHGKMKINCNFSKSTNDLNPLNSLNKKNSEIDKNLILDYNSKNNAKLKSTEKKYKILKEKNNSNHEELNRNELKNKNKKINNLIKSSDNLLINMIKNEFVVNNLSRNKNEKKINNNAITYKTSNEKGSTFKLNINKNISFTNEKLKNNSSAVKTKNLGLVKDISIQNLIVKGNKKQNIIGSTIPQKSNLK